MKNNEVKKIYSVEVTETLSRIVRVTAKDKFEAYKIVKEMYHNETIVLDENDYIDTEINVIDD